MNEYGATIIAVGSELLSGQITNRNAAWISARLGEVGFQVLRHVTVDDVESEIVAALDEAQKCARLVFVTGGLGPTSDDLTRQAVARAAGLSLEWDEPSWAHVQKHFQRLSLEPPATNRQQCYFPKGAAVLTNRAGTANAFAVQLDGKRRIFVLPGPPREVEAVWDEHLRALLCDMVPSERRFVQKMWRTIGRGESHVSELVEAIVQGSGAEVAYRAHMPFIETKVRYPPKEAARYEGLVAKLDVVLAPWLYEKDDENLARSLVRHILASGSVNIYDGATQGLVGELLAPLIREERQLASQLSLATSWEEHDAPELFIGQCLAVNDHVELALAVAGGDAGGEWALGVKRGSQLTTVRRPSLYRGEGVRPRNRAAIAWLAVKAWHEILTQTLLAH